MTNYFIGVDPSIGNTGVSILDENGKLLQVINSKHARKDKNEPSSFFSILRYSYIADTLLTEIKSVVFGAPCYIGYEDYSFSSVNKAQTMGEFNGVLKTGLIQELNVHGFEYLAPSSLKSFAVQDGASGKEKLIAQAKNESQEFAELKKKEQTSDAADSYFLAKFAFCYFNPERAIHVEGGQNYLRERIEKCQNQKKKNQQKNT